MSNIKFFGITMVVAAVEMFLFEMFLFVLMPKLNILEYTVSASLFTLAQYFFVLYLFSLHTERKNAYKFSEANRKEFILSPKFMSLLLVMLIMVGIGVARIIRTDGAQDPSINLIMAGMSITYWMQYIFFKLKKKEQG